MFRITMFVSVHQINKMDYVMDGAAKEFRSMILKPDI